VNIYLDTASKVVRWVASNPLSRIGVYSRNTRRSGRGPLGRHIHPIPYIRLDHASERVEP
jgi:hypothetical protein